MKHDRAFATLQTVFHVLFFFNLTFLKSSFLSWKFTSVNCDAVFRLDAARSCWVTVSRSCFTAMHRCAKKISPASTNATCRNLPRATYRPKVCQPSAWQVRLLFVLSKGVYQGEFGILKTSAQGYSLHDDERERIKIPAVVIMYCRRGRHFVDDARRQWASAVHGPILSHQKLRPP